MERCRCRFANPKNGLYLRYHDEEWGIPVYDDKKLYELLILESFQAGLSWECVLNKREAFRNAFDGFDAKRVSEYGEAEVERLINDAGIIRCKRKICAAIKNSRVFLDIVKEYGSFASYIWHFTEGRVVFEEYTLRTTSPLSDEISRDLKKRGMSFVGSTIVYSLLGACGIINGHERACYLYKEG